MNKPTSTLTQAQPPTRELRLSQFQSPSESPLDFLWGFTIERRYFPGFARKVLAALATLCVERPILFEVGSAPSSI